MDIQLEKKLIVQKIALINDPDLLSVIKSLLDFGLKNTGHEDLDAIPQHHKDILDKRLKNVENGHKPKLITKEELKKRIEEKL